LLLVATVKFCALAARSVRSQQSQGGNLAKRAPLATVEGWVLHSVWQEGNSPPWSRQLRYCLWANYWANPVVGTN